PRRGTRASGNSSPARSESSRHGWGGSESRTHGGSTWRSERASRHRSDTQRAAGPAPVASRVSAFALRTVAPVVPAGAGAGAPAVPPAGRLATIETPNSPTLRPAGPPRQRPASFQELNGASTALLQ